jgi:hypothetical protein
MFFLSHKSIGKLHRCRKKAFRDEAIQFSGLRNCLTTPGQDMAEPEKNNGLRHDLQPDKTRFSNPRRVSASMTQ